MPNGLPVETIRVRRAALLLLTGLLLGGVAVVATPTVASAAPDASTVLEQLGLDIDGEAANDVSGSSVALSADGTTLAIGAPFNDETGDNAGHVRVYGWDGSVWVQQGGDIDGEAANDRVGWSVALSADGTTLAIGAPGAGLFAG